MKVYKILDKEVGWFIFVINDSPTFCKWDMNEEGTLFYSLDQVFYFLESYCNDWQMYHKTRKVEPVKNNYDWIPKDWEIVEFDLIESGQNNLAREVLKNV